MSDGVDRDALQHAIWRTLLDHGHTVSTAASLAAADTALAAFAAGIARDDLARFAPAPRPQLMVELHEAVPWGHWHNPGRLATTLRRHADRLDARCHQALLDALQDLADHLDATVSRDRTAGPWDRGWDETTLAGAEEWRFHRGGEPGADVGLDAELEDEHWAWLDGDGWARRQLHRDAVALAALLARRRHSLRSVFRDGRPYTTAA